MGLDFAFFSDKHLGFECKIRILITGGCGFIGSALVNRFAKQQDHIVINYDKLTYASDMRSVQDAADLPNYNFIQGDICD